MNKAQMQLEVCKAILNQTAFIRGGDINENEYAVTIGGFKCYVFSNKEIIFNKDKIPDGNFSKFLADGENDIELKPTGVIYEDKGKTLVEYVLNDENIYIDKKLVDVFRDFRLFASSALSRIIVKDDFSKTVGLLMPVKFNKVR